jgi:hypothetical protein
MSDVLHSADDPDALKDGVRHFHVVTEDSTMVALTQQMSAVQHNYDNSLVDATNNVNWFSDTPAVATVAPGGLVTAHSAGSSIITCEKPQSIIRASPTTITAPSSLFTLPLTDSVLGYWPLNSNLLDTSGHGVNGVSCRPTSLGVYTAQTAVYDVAVLDKGCYFALHRLSRLDTLPYGCYDSNGGWSFSAWVNISDYVSGPAARYMLHWRGNGPMLRLDYQAGTHKWRLRHSRYTGAWQHGGGSEVIDGSPTTGVVCDIASDVWVHFVFIARPSGSNMAHRTYMNGVFQGEVLSGTYSYGGETPNGNETGLGNNIVNYGSAASDSTAVTWMDEVCIWSRAILDADVPTLFNSGIGKAYPFT